MVRVRVLSLLVGLITVLVGSQVSAQATVIREFSVITELEREKFF